MTAQVDSSNALKIDPFGQAEALMRQGRFDAALEAARGALAERPDDVDGLFLYAVCQRYLHDAGGAEATLKKLLTRAPDFGRALQEIGHLRKAQGDGRGALAAYRLATLYNPALLASWRAQADILRGGGREGEAQAALAEARRLADLPKELFAAANHIYEGKLVKAENLCRAYLQKNPRDVEGMRLLADIGMRLGVMDDAEFLLESAVAFEPENARLRLDYIQCLRKRQKFERALGEARRLHESDPDNPLYQSHYAIERLQTGDVEGALSLFDRVLQTVPDDPATLVSRGHALKTCGRQDDAIASYRAAFRAQPDAGDAYYGLANLKTYRFTDDETAEMLRQADRDDVTVGARISLSFALGKAFEDAGDVARSFEFYDRGNALKRAQSRYDADNMSAELRAQQEQCAPELFARHEGVGCDAPDPIFIVGLPRAGSTLLEQILASHSQVDGTLELPNILSLAQGLRGRRRMAGASAYPAILHDLEAEKFAEFGARYIEETRIHRAGAPFFIDKMPNNFRHIGLIRLILPRAKIIDARREPMACCFSGFKQLFAEGQEFTYGLKEIGAYYRDYVALMRHWDEVLPGAVLRVQHEDVLDDLEGQVRRMLDFCGLPFEASCLDFHKTERSVRTASSEQVRRPINRDGAAQWRKFEAYLNPLREALGPALAEYRA